MALTRAQKETHVEALTKKMSEASSVVFAHYIGLNVADISNLRSTLKKNGSEMKVAKKTLIQIAAKAAGLPDIDGNTLDGPISIIFSYEDPLIGAQSVFAFGKDHTQVELIGGFYDGKVMTKSEAISFANIPGRQQLLAIFARMILSPMVSFASACNSPLSGFARALDAMAEKGVFADPTKTPAAVVDETKEAKEAAEESKEAEEATSELES